VRSLPADSVHHTASTLDRVAQVYFSYATHSGVGDIADTQSAGRLRTLRVLRISSGYYCGIPDGIFSFYF